MLKYGNRTPGPCTIPKRAQKEKTQTGKALLATGPFTMPLVVMLFGVFLGQFFTSHLVDDLH